MAISPQEIRDATFTSVRRGGLDPEEVERFKRAAADALQEAVQTSTAMEARARAAVARLQELSRGATEAPSDAGDESPPSEPPVRAEVGAAEASGDEAATISRTMVLAQRTYDDTVAKAEQEATQIIEDAKANSRRAGEDERVRVEGEVQSLLARRDFLESDVEQLEQHLAAERDRVRDVAARLDALTSQVPDGLGEVRRPQLSASGGFDTDDTDRADDTDDVDVSALIDEVVEDDDSSAEISRVALDAAADAEPGDIENGDTETGADGDPSAAESPAGSDDQHGLFQPNER